MQDLCVPTLLAIGLTTNGSPAQVVARCSLGEWNKHCGGTLVDPTEIAVIISQAASAIVDLTPGNAFDAHAQYATNTLCTFHFKDRKGGEENSNRRPGMKHKLPDCGMYHNCMAIVGWLYIEYHVVAY